MKNNRQTKITLDDKSRFLMVLEYLPEKFVDDSVCCYLYNAYYPVGMNEIIFGYDEYKRTILSEFLNPEISVPYIKFNKSFDMLKDFLSEHFWIPNDHYEMYKNPPFFYLEPRIHHNFSGENENSVLWSKYKNELDKIADELEEAYKSFIKIAKKEIDKKEELFKASPEIYGVGLNLKVLWKKIKDWLKPKN